MEIRKMPNDSALVLLNTYPEDSKSTHQMIQPPPPATSPVLVAALIATV